MQEWSILLGAVLIAIAQVGCLHSGEVASNGAGEDEQIISFDDLGYINSGNQDSFDISGACLREGEDMKYVIRSEHMEAEGVEVLRQQGVVTCQEGRWVIESWDFSAVPDGTLVEIEVFLETTTLDSGNTEQLSMESAVAKMLIVKDTTSPRLTYMGQSEFINMANQESFTFSGTCDEFGEVDYIIASSNGSIECTGDERWLLQIDLSDEQDGEIPITFNITDRAGNRSAPVQGDYIKDTIDPSISIDPIGPVNENSQNNYVLQGDCSDVGQKIKLYLFDGSTLKSAPSESFRCGGNKRWWYTYRPDDLEDGSLTITLGHRDQAGNEVESEYSAIKDTVGPGPKSENIGVPRDGTYTGGSLSFTVGFTELVTVDTGSGTPRIALQIGGNTKYASYIDGTGSDTLIFRYVIQTGDTGTGIANTDNAYSIDLSGGSIVDGAGNSLSSFTLSVPSLLGISIDGRGPSVVSIATDPDTIGSDAYYRAGESVGLKVTFGKNVTINGTSQLIIRVGEQQRFAPYTGTSTDAARAFTFTFTVAAGDNDSDGIEVIGIDGANFISDSGGLNVSGELAPIIHLGTIIVDNEMPVLTGMSDDLNARQETTWAWSCSDNASSPCTYRFVFNGDSTHEFTVTDLYESTSTVDSNTNLNGTYYLHVQAKDSAGNESQIATVSTLLDNVAPNIQNNFISVPDDKIYITNEELYFRVGFDDTVLVDTGDGVPRVVLDLESGIRYAEYNRGSEGEELVFLYVVQSGDEDNNGLELSQLRIDLNGGSIQDQAGNDAIMIDFMPPDFQGIKINSTPPRLSSVELIEPVGGDQYYKSGELVTLLAVFSESVTITSSPSLMLRVNGLDGGVNMISADYIGAEDGSTDSYRFAFEVSDVLHDSDGLMVTDINSHEGIVDSDQNQVVANIVPAIEVLDIVIDADNPSATIDDPVTVTGSNVLSYPLTGTCSEEGEIRIAVSGLANEETVSCVVGIWSAHIDIGSAPLGEVQVTVTPVDWAGNEGAMVSDTFTKESLQVGFTLDTLAVGNLHNCAIFSGGDVKCWGSGESWRLGNNSTSNSRYATPVHADSSGSSYLSDIIHLVGASSHTCGLSSAGTVSCWGDGGLGRLGNDNIGTDNSYAQLVVSEDASNNLSGVVQMTSGRDTACALLESGQIVCWGKGLQVPGSSSGRPMKVRTSQAGSPLDDIVQISSFGNVACGVTSQGQVMCWGSGAQGKLGNGSTAYQRYPVTVLNSAEDTTPLGGIVQVSLGGSHACALTMARGVKCWGGGSSGALGDGTNDSSNYPVSVVAGEESSDPLGNIVQIRASAAVTCAMSSTGEVLCWGNGYYGILGNNSYRSTNIPENVIAAASTSTPLSSALSVHMVQHHGCIVGVDERVRCWGLGNNGIIGDVTLSVITHPNYILESSGSLNFLRVENYRRGYHCSLSGGTCAISPINLSLAGTTMALDNESSIGIIASGISSGERITLYSDSACATTVGSIETDEGTVNITALSEGIHHFHYRLVGGSRDIYCSQDYLPYYLDLTPPDAPSVYVLLDAYPFPQAAVTGTNTTPGVRVSDVEWGDLINVYTDDQCSGAVTGTAYVSTTSYNTDITVSPIEVGATSFYARSVDSAGNVSSCSTMSATYTLRE